jgi:hypothetical protein
MAIVIQANELAHHFGAVKAVDALLIWLGVRIFSRERLLSHL